MRLTSAETRCDAHRDGLGFYTMCSVSTKTCPQALYSIGSCIGTAPNVCLMRVACAFWLHRPPPPPGHLQVKPTIQGSLEQARPGQTTPGRARSHQTRLSQARPGSARPGQASVRQARAGQVRLRRAMCQAR